MNILAKQEDPVADWVTSAEAPPETIARELIAMHAAWIADAESAKERTPEQLTSRERYLRAVTEVRRVADRRYTYRFQAHAALIALIRWRPGDLDDLDRRVAERDDRERAVLAKGYDLLERLSPGPARPRRSHGPATCQAPVARRYCERLHAQRDSCHDGRRLIQTTIPRPPISTLADLGASCLETHTDTQDEDEPW